MNVGAVFLGLYEGEARGGLWEGHDVWKAAAFYNLQRKWLERVERDTEGIVNLVQLNEGWCGSDKMQLSFCFYSLQGKQEWPLDEAG